MRFLPIGTGALLLSLGANGSNSGPSLANDPDVEAMFKTVSGHFGNQLTREMADQALASGDFSGIFSMLPVPSNKKERNARRLLLGNLRKDLIAYRQLYEELTQFLVMRDEARTVDLVNKFIAGELPFEVLGETLKSDPEMFREVKTRVFMLRALIIEAPMARIFEWAHRVHEGEIDHDVLQGPKLAAAPDMSPFLKADILSSCELTFARDHKRYSLAHTLADSAHNKAIKFAEELVVRLVMEDFVDSGQVAEVENSLSHFRIFEEDLLGVFEKLGTSSDLPAVARSYMTHTVRMKRVQQEAWVYVNSLTLGKFDASADEILELLNDKQWEGYLSIKQNHRLAARYRVLLWTPEESTKGQVPEFQIGAALEAIDTYNPELFNRETTDFISGKTVRVPDLTVMLNHLARQIAGMDFSYKGKSFYPTPDRARTRLIKKYQVEVRAVKGIEGFDPLTVLQTIHTAERFWMLVDSARKSLNECVWARSWGLGLSFFNVDPTFEEDVTEAHIAVASTEILSERPYDYTRHDRFDAYLALHKLTGAGPFAI